MVRGPYIGPRAAQVLIVVLAAASIIGVLSLLIHQDIKSQQEWNEDWFARCVDGQVVLISVRNSKQVIAVNKLDPDGTPVVC